MDVRGKQSSEKRLIDADRAMEIVRNQGSEYPNAYHLTNYATLILREAPTVDAVEVVRCRECKHHYWEQEPCHGKSVHYCKLPHMRGVEVFKEFFCYYGEREEGADNEP